MKLFQTLTLLFTFTILFADGVQPVGLGTEAEPYQIATLDNLLWVSTNEISWDKYFIQTADIDASDTQNWNDGEGFSPIGYNSFNPFFGEYNGQEYTITGLYINRSTSSFQGFFGFTNGAVINDLRLSNIYVHGNDYTGSIVGQNFNHSTILNSSCSGEVIGGNYTGGLAGKVSLSGTITNSYYSGITNGASYVGGITGHLHYNSIIDNCFSSGNVQGNFITGGIVGENDAYSNISNSLSACNIIGINRTGGIAGYNEESSSIFSSSNTGNIEGNNNIGGVVGFNNANIGNCYSLGNVDGNDDIGGLVGENYSNGSINNSYSIGNVIGLGDIGGLIGYGDVSSITNSFWNTESSGQTSSAGGIGLSTSEMHTLSTFTDAGWDFAGETDNGTNDIWDMNGLNNNCYPYLSWQTFSLLAELPLGSGRENDPHQIASLNNLLWISINPVSWNRHYIQTADIDAADTQNWNCGEGFYPIGNNSNRFTGDYNGQNYTIDGLYVNRPGSGYQALFGYIFESNIENIGIINADIFGADRIGGLVGLSNDSVINNSYFIGNIVGENFVGGLVGSNYDSSVISNCYSSGDLTGAGKTGGLVGRNYYHSIIRNSYSNVVVTGMDHPGGLVGWNYQFADINDCYSTGSVSGEHFIGGLVGNNYDGASINNCYSTGSVSGNSYIGGLVGQNAATMSNSFWNMESSGTTLGVGSGYINGATGKNELEMLNLATFTDLATEGLDEPWDFTGTPFDDTGIDDDWALLGLSNNGSPFLSWQNVSQLGEEPSGSGTETTPYQIASLENLIWMCTNSTSWDKNYVQTNDIDAGETQSWLGGTGFIPIGNTTNQFTGNYNGQNYSISNIFINRSTMDYQGFFGKTSNAYIENLSIIEININGYQYIGSLVGSNESSSIENCIYSGSVTGDFNVGGLIGNNISSSIANCSSTGDVSGYDRIGGFVGSNESSTNANCNITGNVSGADTVGGFAGFSTSSSIVNCTGTGNVTGNDNIGGLIGHSLSDLNIGQSNGNCSVDGTDTVGGLIGLSSSSSIVNCKSTGNVTGNLKIGGLIGFNIANSNINKCISTCNVTGTNAVGGVVGYNYSCPISGSSSGGSINAGSFGGGLIGINHSGAISNCYNTGAVNGLSEKIGGLVGQNMGAAVIDKCYSIGSVYGTGMDVGGLIGTSVASSINSFWNIETSGQTISAGGTGKTTAEMKDEATFTYLSTIGLDSPWDFISNPFDDTANFNDWIIHPESNDGYPYLNWQEFSNPDFIYQFVEIYENNQDEFSLNDVAADIQFISEHPATTIFITYYQYPPSTTGSLPNGLENIAHKYWNVVSSEGTNTGTYNISFDTSEIIGIDNFDTLTFLKRDDESMPWQDVESIPGITAVRNEPLFTILGLSGFSDFVPAGDIDNPLPVELSSFTAVQTAENAAQLDWITQSENNLLGYNIYRNITDDAQSSIQVNPLLIEGMNTSQEQSYSFTDADVLFEQTYYYWLESVALGSGTELFGAISLTVETQLTPELPTVTQLNSAYPNPFNPITTIEFDVKKGETGMFSIFNIKGQLILSEKYEPGSYNYKWNADKYSSGVYFYRLKTNSFSEVYKMLMLK
jgi:hypothetical protein